MITVKIDVSGAVKKVRSAGAAFDQALTEIGDSVLKRVRDGFATNGHHGKWKRMAPNTLVSGHASSLVRTGKLRGSFRSKVFGNRV